MERLQSVQKQKIALREKVKRLEKEKKARTLIEREGVRLSREDTADIQTTMKENSDKVDSAFAEESFQRILWEHRRTILL